MAEEWHKRETNRKERQRMQKHVAKLAAALNVQKNAKRKAIKIKDLKALLADLTIQHEVGS